jgi:uncharacterized membrane protein SpoIIM required for sporulation
MGKNKLALRNKIRQAVYNAKYSILSVALVYLISVSVGIVMAYTENKFALNYRDKLVAKAQKNDRAAIAYREGNNFKAAVIDFAQNLTLGAIPQTITGLTIISPHGFAAFRGWVGGIVSVDKQHKSRLADPKHALYYIITLILQLIPYSLAGGIGVKLGLSYFRRYPEYQNDKRYLGYPVGALKDVLFVYILIIPLFFIASLWEFLSTWN